MVCTYLHLKNMIRYGYNQSWFQLVTISMATIRVSVTNYTHLVFLFTCVLICQSFFFHLHVYSCVRHFDVFTYFYQNQFDNIYRKYITYTGGEELFGLPVTQYPQLLEIKKQLNLLQKIYTLYNSVIETVNSYHDILWSEVNIEKINSELLEFQNR